MSAALLISQSLDGKLFNPNNSLNANFRKLNEFQISVFFHKIFTKCYTDSTFGFATGFHEQLVLTSKTSFISNLSA